MKIKDIAFTSYSVTDIKRSKEFYEGVLGLIPASVYDAEGMTFIEYEIGSGCVTIGTGNDNFKPGPAGGGIVTLEVENFDEAMSELKAKKVAIVMDAMDTGVCHLAIIEDPDGNRIMIHKKK